MTLLTVACQPKREKSVSTPRKEHQTPQDLPKPRIKPVTIVTEQPVRLTEDPRIEQVTDTLWSSQIGKIYYDYLFGDPDNHASSREVVDRIFEDGGSSVTRLSALQLLTEQLYDHRLIGEQEMKKLIVLQGDIHQRQTDLAKSPTENMAYIALGSFITLLPFGLPYTRNAALKLAKRLPVFLQPESVRAKRPQSMMLKNLLKSYEPTFVIRTFFKYFGPFSILYFAWFDWKESTRGHSIPYTLEDLSEDKFIGFLEDLKKL